ncbi:MAG: acyltransferase [Bacteroidota bacterium]
MADNRFKNWAPPEIEDGIPTRWNWVVQHVTGLELEPYTDIGAFTYINARYGVTLEEWVQIGSHCSIYSHSTIDGKQGKVTLKRNARIGAHSVVMPGVTVGKNSIVGAFSFVNRDIPDNVIAVGQPVRIVRPLTEEEKHEN